MTQRFWTRRCELEAGCERYEDYSLVYSAVAISTSIL